MSGYLCEGDSDIAAVASPSMKASTNLFANPLYTVSCQLVSPTSSIALKKHVC